MSFSNTLSRLREAAKGQRGRSGDVLVSAFDLRDLLNDYDRIDSKHRNEHREPVSDQEDEDSDDYDCGCSNCEEGHICSFGRKLRAKKFEADKKAQESQDLAPNDSEDVEWNAKCSCGHKWLCELPTENCPKCRPFTANKAEVPTCFMRLFDHAYGLTFWEDWNIGTAAKFHRDNLISAAHDCDSYLKKLRDSLPPLKDGE